MGILYTLFVDVSEQQYELKVTIISCEYRECRTVFLFGAPSLWSLSEPPHSSQHLETIGYIFAADSIMRGFSLLPKVLSERQNTQVETEFAKKRKTEFNAKWPFSIIQGHLFCCQ